MSLKHIAFGFRFFSIIILLILLVGPQSITPVHATSECYVWKDATSGNNDGTSWTDAYTDLQVALGNLSCTEIWVAAGTYTPGTNRTDTFQLTSGAAIYGGFAGTESARDDRDPGANLTILSGEIGDENIITDNNYHVVSGDGLTASAVLDGFFITAGNADGTTPNDSGGGMFLTASSPTLTNITFSANTAIGGGGMFLESSSSPTLTNVTFSANTGLFAGGGMSLFDSSPILTNVTFSANTTLFAGGGMILRNSSPVLRNSIMWGNTAPNGSQIYILDSSITLSTSLVEGGIGVDATGIFNDNSEVTDGGGNLAANPMFVNAANGDLHLQADSPAIDTGTNAVISLTTDLDGNPRFVDGDLDESAIVDMGAYEYQPCPSGPVVYVDQSSTLIVRGESWETALQNPQDALNVAAACGGISEIWVAAGVYTPGVLLTDSFQLLPGVALYGGFSGGESSLDERDWVNNPTILSGDIDGNDTNSDGNSIAETPTDMVGDNSYHVVYADGSTTPITESTILDGFIITAGNADDPDVGSTEIVGGGMFLNNSSPSLTNITFSGNTALGGGGMFLDTSNPTLTNVTFITNTASTNGGGMFLFSSSPTLANVSFSYNQATRYGGAIYNNSSNPGLTNITINNNSLTGTRAYGGGIYNENSSPTLTYVTFSENSVSGSTASGGGGMINWNSSHPTLTNVTFTGNQATGTEAYGGGLLNDTGSNPTLTNVTFSNNSATSGGGGMTNNDGSSPELTNVTFSGNNASLGGGMINGYNSPTPTLRNTIFWGNTADSGTTSQEQIYTITGTSAVSDSVIEGGYTGGVNITTTNPNLGTLGNYGGFTQTIPLLPGSSAINAGDGITCPLTDQRGNSRVGVCDIGTFESQGFTFSSPTGTNQSTIINTAFATPLGLSVTANAAGEPVDGGVVTFTSSLDNTWRTNPATFTTVIADGVVSATATANDITGGPYPVMASATGAASGVSFNLTNSAAPTTTTNTTTILTASENFDVFGESWTLTATVTSESGTPSGSVTFKDGTQTLGTAALSNGVASFSTGRLPGGAYIFTAEYEGSTNYTDSVSNALNLTANYYMILPLVFR